MNGPRHPITLLLILFGLNAVRAQPAWPVDSLLNTWPVQQRLGDVRFKPRPGMEVDTGDLYTEIKRIAPTFPVFADSTVEQYVNTFSGPRREHLRAMLGMAALIQPMIEQQLEERRMPDEIKYLPLALSAMNTQAGTTTGGAGPWLLNAPVAVRYGLTVNATVDERRDPVKSTRAALRHLQDLHGRYGNWPTAVIAFTCGPANLNRALKRNGGDPDPRLLYAHFSSEQRAVLPMLMAFTYLAHGSAQRGLDPMTFRMPEPLDTIHYDSLLSIEALTHVVGTRPARFGYLNPTLIGGTIPAGMPFLLPRSDAARFPSLAFVVLEAQQTRPRRPLPLVQTPESLDRLPDGREAILYRITVDDCMNCIADRFGLQVDEIRSWNDLADDQIEAGNTLVLYVQPAQRLSYEAETPGARLDTLMAPQRSDTVRTKTPVPDRRVDKKPSEGTWYTVRNGDSLYGIAKRFSGVSAEDIMKFNSIGANIRPGQRLRIPDR